MKRKYDKHWNENESSNQTEGSYPDWNCGYDENFYPYYHNYYECKNIFSLND